MSIDIKAVLAEKLSTAAGISKNKIADLLEIPPQTEFGDFALPCFSLSIERNRNPTAIAHDIEEDLQGRTGVEDIIAKAESRGPYLNIYLNRAFIIDKVVSYMSDTNFLHLRENGKGKTVLIDFSSPNIAKPFGIGHLRSTVIGNSLKKIHDFLGYRIIGINHLGDWGTQFGKLITAFKRWGKRDELLHQDPIQYLYELYVKFHSEAEDNPNLEDEARQWFSRLEKNDPEAVQLWEDFKNLSIAEFKRIYGRLGVEFEYYTGESFYSDMLDETILRIKKSGVAELSEGALVITLDKGDLPPALLRKSDGSTLYLTRDIAAAFYRYETFHFDLALYVVGSPQTLHFKQLFRVLQKLGEPWYKNCHHIPFGQIRFKDSSMSTRRGNIVFLEEVLDNAVALALQTIREKNPGLKDKKRIAESVGVGSIIFNDLKNYRIKDINFDWDEIINFNGETGVYLQYTHARSCSLLKKYQDRYGNVQYAPNLPFGEEGYTIALLLNDFESTVLRAAEAFEPSIIARYLLELASQFNSFYNRHRVITPNAPRSQSRALIVSGVQKVLKLGLELLGIEAVKEM